MDGICIFRYAIFVISFLIICFSLIPPSKNSAWYIRIFDYPRSQKFWINLILLVSLITIIRFERNEIILLCLLTANQIYLLTQIWNYTKLAPLQMMRNTNANRPSIRLFIANVCQDNTDYEACIQMIKQYNADILLLIEIDNLWNKRMEVFHDEYPYKISQAQQNTYGIVLYSKIEIIKSSIRFLTEADVPSIVADMKLQDGKIFRFYGLHPKPPVPGESDESTERDAEILMIGKEAKQCKYPVMVAGDLNDVAWSYTTSLFMKVSGLLDPRIGRGFYSTFHASYTFLRWPLDHVFCSAHFLLNHMERLPTIGTDHFPIFIDLALMDDKIENNVQNEKESSPEESELDDDNIEVAR